MNDSKRKFTEEQLEADILRRLARNRRWGGKHTPLIYVRSGLPPEYRDKAEDLAKNLRNKGLVVFAPKTSQIHIWLNPHKKKEIMEIVEKHFGKQIWL